MVQQARRVARNGVSRSRPAGWCEMVRQACKVVERVRQRCSVAGWQACWGGGAWLARWYEMMQQGRRVVG